MEGDNNEKININHRENQDTENLKDDVKKVTDDGMRAKDKADEPKGLGARFKHYMKTGVDRTRKASKNIRHKLFGTTEVEAIPEDKRE
ncbi:hypothetical protein COBT_000786 [Conglomerata obtusa]